MWKMLHLLHIHGPSLRKDQLRSAGINCDADTIWPLINHKAVQSFPEGVPWDLADTYRLSDAANGVLQTCLVANRQDVQTDLRVDEPKVFIIMPFSQPWSDAVLKEFIEPAVLDGGFAAVRGDQIIRAGDLTKNILAELLTCGLAVADVTAPNPNVFYEVGLCHALGKDVLLLKQQGAALPADFGGAHYYEYDPGDLPRHKVALEDMIRRWGAEHHSHEIKALS
jgi:hypothetical protein